MGVYQENHGKQGYTYCVDLSRNFCIHSFWRLESHLSLPERETFSQMNISLINIIVSCKNVTSNTQFSEFILCLLFLRNHPLKITLMPKKHILGQHILLPFRNLSQESRRVEEKLFSPLFNSFIRDVRLKCTLFIDGEIETSKR